jgi:hypothetical protein
LCVARPGAIAHCPLQHSQIEECTIDFNAKITSVTKSSSDIAMQQSLTTSASGGFIFGSASMTASFSAQQRFKNSNEENREFSMHVYVRAKQTEMPAGMAKILGVLEEAILITLRRDFAASE